MFHLPIEVSVYVPSTQDVDKVVSKTEMTSRINEVKKYLATLFGGFSSAPVEGGFLASDKKVVKEDVERVNSFALKEDFDKNKEALVQKASEWAREWGQEAIGLEHEGDLYYVPQKFENGGTIAIREAKEMANSQAIELKHHVSELANVLKKNPTIEAWVIAKLERASNDLSDVTHYLDGRVQMSGKKMATGGNLSKKMIKVKAVYLEQQYFELTKEMEIPLSVYKEYDKTGKLPLDLQQELCEETSVEHWVETNPIMTILTPITSDKMATGRGVQVFKNKTKLENVGSIDFDSDDYTLVLYHEEKGNWFIPKDTVYYWLYEDKDAGKKLRDEEYDYVFYPQTSMTLAFQKGYVPPIKKIWTPKFQKQNRGSEKLIGVVQGYINDKGDKLVIEMMSTNPKKQKQGVMSNMIKQLRQQFNLSQEQVEFKDLTKQGESFVSKKKYADGGVIDPNSNEVQFIKYKDEEIMYEPHFKEYYVNDSMFHSLEEAKQFIDGGAPMSLEIKEAYRKGLFKKGGSVGGGVGNNVLEYLFNNPDDITPIKFNSKSVGGIDVTTYRGDTETLRVHKMLILPEFQGKGIGAKAINKLFRDNPNVKQIIGNATAESKSFWQKIGAEFHSNEHTAFTITRKPDIRFDSGGNMEFERPSYQSNYVAGQAQANEIADENWNMDYENDPLIKAQKKAKETATRAAMAYATKGMSETTRQTVGAQGGVSSGMDMSALMKGFKK